MWWRPEPLEAEEHGNKINKLHWLLAVCVEASAILVVIVQDSFDSGNKELNIQSL